MTAEAVNSHAGDDLPPKRSRGGVTSGASLGCEAVDSHAGDDLPPKRSRGGVTSGAAMSAEAVNSHAGDDLPPKRSRGGVTSGASLDGGSRQLSCWRRPAAEAEPRGRYLWSQPWLRSRRFSLQLKKKLCINPMQQLLF